MKIVSRKITEATVNNLTPGREYEFMVLSQDKHGDGMFSKAVRVLTEPGIYFNNDNNNNIKVMDQPDYEINPFSHTSYTENSL